MRQLSLVRRLLLSAVAVVQFTAPALAVAADARLVADAGTPQVHVEDHSQKNCRPVHPDDCALCQLLTHFSAPRAAGAAVPSETAGGRAVFDLAPVLAASTARAQARTRAPPVSLS